MKERVNHMLLGLGVIIIGVFVDQITKIIAFNSLKDQPNVKVIDNFFYFSYVENKGGAWGLMSGYLWVFIIITIASLGIFAYMMKYYDLKQYPMYSISLLLLITGTIGNFIDRIFRGFVVDFLDFHIFKYNFPVFNVADICLTIGIGILLFDIIFGKSGDLL